MTNDCSIGLLKLPVELPCHPWFGLDTSNPEAVSAREFLGAATYAGIYPNVTRAMAGAAASFECEMARRERERRSGRATFRGWPNTHAGTVDGSEHLLGTAETQVLRAFVARPCQTLTREQLIGRRDLSPLDRSIDVRISRLRRKLESDRQDPKIIETVYDTGYMFSAAVTWS